MQRQEQQKRNKNSFLDNKVDVRKGKLARLLSGAFKQYIFFCMIRIIIIYNRIQATGTLKLGFSREEVSENESPFMRGIQLYRDDVQGVPGCDARATKETLPSNHG